MNLRTGLVGAALLGFTLSSHAVSYSLDLAQVYSGTAPANPQSPWLRATVEDIAGGKVRLTLEAPNLTANEFVGTWSFNLNPALSPSALTFSLSTSDPGQVSPSGVNHDPTGQNYKAGPGEYFDIQFANQTANNAGRFTAGETLIYDVGLITGTLSAGDFLFVNQQKIGQTLINDEWYSAAHVQAIGASGQSGWIGANVYNENDLQTAPLQSVPDRGRTMIMLAASIASLAAIRHLSGQPAKRGAGLS